MKIVAIGKSWEKATLAKDASYEDMLYTIALPCPQHAPSAKYHMLQYCFVHPHNQNSTQQEFPALPRGNQSPLPTTEEDTNASAEDLPPPP